MDSKSKLPFINNLRSPEFSERMPLPKKPKVLMVDNDPQGRKERINVLRANGFAAYPALDMKQAGTRCKPGAYDLIVVNSRDEKERALEFCDAVRNQSPHQLLLLMTTAETEGDSRIETVSDNPQKLLERVQTMLNKQTHSAEVPVAA
jgi:DNA-binding response OmpR family regulator